jgi:hypothetical protein
MQIYRGMLVVVIAFFSMEQRLLGETTLIYISGFTPS